MQVEASAYAAAWTVAGVELELCGRCQRNAAAAMRIVIAAAAASLFVFEENIG
jgi:hypothetical protein